MLAHWNSSTCLHMFSSRICYSYSRLNLSAFISGSYGTMVVELKIWWRKLIDIEREYTKTIKDMVAKIDWHRTWIHKNHKTHPTKWSHHTTYCCILNMQQIQLRVKPTFFQHTQYVGIHKSIFYSCTTSGSCLLDLVDQSMMWITLLTSCFF